MKEVKRMQLMTIEQVCEVLRVKRARVYELIREGLLPSVRLGRQVRISEDALRAWIKDGGKPLPGGWRKADEIKEEIMNPKG